MAALIDDEDFLIFLLEYLDDELLLMDLLPEQQETTYDPTWPLLDIENLTDTQCKAYFRFEKADLHRLVVALQLPPQIVLPNRCTMSGLYGLTVFLRRLTYPNRLLDLEQFFGRPKTTLSMAVNYVADHIYENFKHKVSDLGRFVNRMQMYADAIRDKGAALSNCFGFVDGTVRPICRPIRYQRICFNGHKRVHSLKFQSILTPDGLIAHLWGPLEGRRHDCALLQKSEIQEQFQNGNWLDRNGLQLCIYGDPAYPIRDYLQSPFKGANLNEDQLAFNRSMSSSREAVEWGFGKILSQFAFLDFKKNLKVFLQPVGVYYILGAILANCHTCIYSSQSSEYFGVEPPTLEEYLA